MLYACVALLVPANAVQEGSVGFAERVAPFLAEHCLACHGPEKQKSGLDFRAYSGEASARGALDVFEEARARLLAGEMPPEEQPRPSTEAIAGVVAWIDGALADELEDSRGDPGHSRLRRLSRFEYRNTIRDLFGVDFDAVGAFPPDEVAHGFENVGEVQSFSPLLLEKYLAAAEDIAPRALAVLRGSERTRVTAPFLRSPEQEFPIRDDARILYRAGLVAARFPILRDGEYAVRVSAGADQAGDELASLAVRVDGREIARMDVHAELPKLEVHEVTVALQAGDSRIGAAFLNDYYVEEAPGGGSRDRNLGVSWIEIEGPLGTSRPSGPLAEILGTLPAAGKESLVAPLSALAARVWRRPVTSEEVDALLALTSAEDLPLARIERALVAMLVSPHFLVRVELDPSPDDATPHALGPHELATRLSYLLWSSTPDARLASLADSGAIADDGVLRGEVDRMLSSPGASALVEGFFVPWLGLRRMDEVTPDPARFPDFDDELREAMRAETELFLESILYEERPVAELLCADYTFANERLAQHYRWPPIPGERMRRTTVPADRAGLLTQASILTLTSNPTRTSPVKRGKWILETLLGTPPDPPPPGVGVLDESEAAERAASLRERLAEHRSKPECAACHAALDPLGLALENFGPTGRWRDVDGGHAIDASAELPDGRQFTGARELASLLLEQGRFERALVERLLAYALGRELGRVDRPTVDGILAALSGSPVTLRAVLRAIVLSPPFRMRRAETADSGV